MTAGNAYGWPASARAQLLERKSRLESARIARPEAAELDRLLLEVDAALGRIASGSFGLCETCGDAIEADRMAADPLTRFCIDHLSGSERRALERDLELAVQIQTSLLPDRDFSAHGWEAWYHYQPAGPVSGDYCDIVAADGAGVYFFAGDVAGKGVAASLLMSHLHAIFRSLVQFRMPVMELMRRANHIFCESTSASNYATLLCGHARPDGEIDLANAGHCPPVWVRRDGVETIEATGLPFGMFCSAEYPTRKLHAESGDSLILYTDGLTEARNGSDAEYGAERLCTLAAGRHGLPARALAEECISDLREFAGAGPLRDDLTVVVIRRAPAA